MSGHMTGQGVTLDLLLHVCCCEQLACSAKTYANLSTEVMMYEILNPAA